MKWYPKQRRKRWMGVGLASLMGLFGCGDTAYIPPPTPNLGGSLNTLSAEAHPRFSHDGRYLVFVSDRQGQRRILLYDRQSQRLLPLLGLNPPGILLDQPDISADGRYIVYVSEQSGKPDIWLYDRQTNDSKNLTQNWLGEVRYPTISGDGRVIAFESNRSGQWDIVIYERNLP